MTTFVEACLRGDVAPAAIYNYVDAWHEANTELPLPEYLGFCAEEYEAWLERPAVLAAILAARRDGIPFATSHR